MKRILLFLVMIILLGFCSCANERTDTTSHKKDVYCSKVETTASVKPPQAETTYILNTNSKKIHKSTCGTATLILPENRKEYCGSIEDMLNQGYTTCGNCFRQN